MNRKTETPVREQRAETREAEALEQEKRAETLEAEASEREQGAETLEAQALRREQWVEARKAGAPEREQWAETREAEAMRREQWAEARLDYRFNDPALLELALTHSGASKRNNQRLEFLGDAVLEVTISRLLFESRPDDAEGVLTDARAALVNGRILAKVGRELAIDTQIIVGKGQSRANLAQSNKVLADALEALIGAVFVDGGHAAADRLVQRLFMARLAVLRPGARLKGAKSRLQEWLQGRGLDLPSYTIDAERGSDHAKVFVVSCDVGELAAPTSGEGSNLRHAEQAAATAMLRELTGEQE